MWVCSLFLVIVCLVIKDIQTKTLLTLQLVKLMNTGLFALPKEINCLKVEIIYILQLDIFLTFIH